MIRVRRLIKLHGMLPGPRRITVEIDSASDPIRGRVGDDGAMRPFVGWLELAAALRAEFDARSAPDDIEVDG